MRSCFAICGLLFILMTGSLFSQTTACCDSVVALPDTMARFGKGNGSLMKFSEKELFPLLGELHKETEIMITGLRTKLVIDCRGQVTEVIILNKELPQSYKEKLAGKFLAMNAWEPAYLNGKPVCCTFYFPISCIKWE